MRRRSHGALRLAAIEASGSVFASIRLCPRHAEDVCLDVAPKGQNAILVVLLRRPHCAAGAVEHYFSIYPKPLPLLLSLPLPSPPASASTSADASRETSTTAFGLFHQVVPPPATLHFYIYNFPPPLPLLVHRPLPLLVLPPLVYCNLSPTSTSASPSYVAPPRARQRFSLFYITSTLPRCR